MAYPPPNSFNCPLKPIGDGWCCVSTQAVHPKKEKAAPVENGQKILMEEDARARTLRGSERDGGKRKKRAIHDRNENKKIDR